MEELDLDDPFAMPAAMPLLLLDQVFYFPGTDLPLRISSEVHGTIVEHALETDQMLAVGCFSETGTLFPVVTAGTIKSVTSFADGASGLVLLGLQRMRIVGLNQLRPFPIVRVESIPYSAVDPLEFEQWQQRIGQLLEARALGYGDFFSRASEWVQRVEDPAMICDVLGTHVLRGPNALRSFLAEESTSARMETLLGALSESGDALGEDVEEGPEEGPEAGAE
jgi:Lon protease-like protein